jgi:glycosyltransferase involved in cell wall biosynthesis
VSPAAPAVEDGHGICVLGRVDFGTGIGKHTAAALELLGRGMDVSLYPTRTPAAALGPAIQLPSGRVVPVVDALEGFAAYWFADVLWNGAGDLNYTAMPRAGHKVAYLAFDSDELPEEWVTILNERFDLVLFTSAFLVEVAERSGVTIPAGVLPLALDLEELGSRRVSAALGRRVRFGTVSAFHDRKNLEVLIEAFNSSFGADEPVELVIHSNLAFGRTYDRIAALVAALPGDRISLSTDHRSDEAVQDLMTSFDVYVNVAAGEGYSIGPREALALGTPLVLSDIPAHADLAGLPGVFMVEPAGWIPARYPELDDRTFGRQARITGTEVGTALRLALDFAQGPELLPSAQLRRGRALQFSQTVLEPDYRRVLDPDAPRSRAIETGSDFSRLPQVAIGAARRQAGPQGRRVGRKKLVLPAHDGGFFSLFNSYLSHLAWSMQESSPPMVLPDWDAGRLVKRLAPEPIVSYCYSKPGDGNLWRSLFEPLYGLSDADMDDAELLYGGARVIDDVHNAHYEPLLTFTHAYDLYRAPWFARFRRQYHDVLSEHVQLRPAFQAEIDAMKATLAGRFVVSVHVKHPSHAIEQPDERIAGRDEYLAAVRQVLRTRGIPEQSDEWGVFVATDQERVTAAFRDAFGEHVIAFDDVTRVGAEIDEGFDQLSEAEKLADGHQLQHQLAADQQRWSTRLAWEVWRDAEAMAASDVLLHAVSNVATAVSFLSPGVEMIYCSPDQG